MIEGVQAFFGEWNLDRGASRYEYGEVPRRAQLWLTLEDDAVRVRMVVEGSRGTPVTLDGLWPFAPGGDRESRVEGGQTLVQTFRREGQVSSVMRRELSDDGQTLTTRHDGHDEDGQPWTNVSVFRRASQPGTARA